MMGVGVSYVGSGMCKEEENLVLASRASRGISGLRVGLTVLHLGTLVHHLLEANITTHWVLVEGFTRVDTGGIRGVSSEGLERVEVHWGTRGGRVPFSVNILLGGVVPKLVVVLSVRSEGRKGSGEGRLASRGESRSRSGKGEDGEKLEL